MATRKTTSKANRGTAAEPADQAPAQRAGRKSSAKSPAKSASKKRPAKSGSTRTADKSPASKAARKKSQEAEQRILTVDQRERKFNSLVQTACLKAGTAAAISTITHRVPFLGRLAPVILGSAAESMALNKIQTELVRDIIALYEVDLTEPEERGVVLLATAARVGAAHLSKLTVNQLVQQLGGVLYRPVLARVLPLAAVATDISAAVASTYAVGKRAQALCTLPGTGARDLSDLLRGLSGIDQTRLYKWSAEALGLALKPFRGALTAIIPGLK
ncbi:hypothetical protein [Pseudomarimonas arenosa]|uniref:EcsC family protein n=1 Tax=Pseudomarimonas arenosa TaxID=2774145 RepID=A0AAW3ZH45_9GAMM|nr:hypothetical protein [Pseudomarimonas arenosa]MBD8525346.1 hypothetical protein [Pseudomarimonas arenosa]